MRISISIQDFLRKINSSILTLFPLRNIVFFAIFSGIFFLHTLTLLLVSSKERHIFTVTHNPIHKSESEASLPYVASKTGKKYYDSTCSFVKKIKDKNKIYFKTEEEAESAGKVKSTVCE